MRIKSSLALQFHQSQSWCACAAILADDDDDFNRYFNDEIPL